MRGSIVLVILSIFFFISPALADAGSARFLSELSEGMSYADVLSAWGVPNEKVEQEAKRVDIWIYDDSRVQFADGKLTSIESTAGEQVALQEDSSSGSGSGGTDVPVSDILNEIMDSTR